MTDFNKALDAMSRFRYSEVYDGAIGRMICRACGWSMALPLTEISVPDALQIAGETHPAHEEET